MQMNSDITVVILSCCLDQNWWCNHTSKSNKSSSSWKLCSQTPGIL